MTKKLLTIMAVLLATALVVGRGDASPAEWELRATPEALAEMAEMGSVLTLAPETLSGG
jgi:hypothetical protein